MVASPMERVGASGRPRQQTDEKEIQCNQRQRDRHVKSRPQIGTDRHEREQCPKTQQNEVETAKTFDAKRMTKRRGTKLMPASTKTASAASQGGGSSR